MRHVAMMTSSNVNISSLLALCEGNSPVTINLLGPSGPSVTNIIWSISVHIIVWYLFSRQSGIARTNADLLPSGAYGTILHFFSDLNVILHASSMNKGGIPQLWSDLASRAARLRIADCLPGDYNIPRSFFNSLNDLSEIWHTGHWWAKAIDHQFWVEYDNSEFSVPSMRIGCLAI